MTERLETAHGCGRQCLRRELEQALHRRNKAGVMDKLYQANPTEVPNVLIENQGHEMQIDAMRRAGTKDHRRRPLVNPSLNRRGVASRWGFC